MASKDGLDRRDEDGEFMKLMLTWPHANHSEQRSAPSASPRGT